MTLDHRVLVMAPTSRDASVTELLLASSGIEVEICLRFDALVIELERGAAAILIPEEAVASPSSNRLRTFLAQQPPWSDLPVLVLTRPGANSTESGDAVRTLGNVTLLERPVRIATLVSAVRTALRARDRQYQMRMHLAERTRAEDSLRVADKRKDEFLATLGHELRNPLAPLLTGLHLIKTVGSENPTVSRTTVVMERQINHLVTLVDDLLEMSRITRGLIELECEQVDLAKIVTSALDASQPSLAAAGHKVTVDLPLESIRVPGDFVRLTQVFVNLLANAAKYTDAGGSICVKVERMNTHALVSVRDNGIGITPEHLDSIFDMFMQVDRSNRRAQGGLGIGLTLVRSLVEMHGGRVEARSEGVGAGSEFIVELPVVTEPLTTLKRDESSAMFPARRVLVVDDNVDAADTLADLLELRGATVAVAYSGHDALENLARFNPDAVLLDIGMPVLDGYEVARQIRTSAHASVLLIALTGWGQDRDHEQSRAAGFDHHLVKPPDLNRLRELLIEEEHSVPCAVVTSQPGRR